MLSKILSVFTSNTVGSIERIASELIETDKESAEAKALWIKTLDPNGMMRRDLSRFACVAYGYYLLITSLLALAHAFGLGDPIVIGDVTTTTTKQAMEGMTGLFLPITSAWGAIVTASFGVNATNTLKENKT